MTAPLSPQNITLADHSSTLESPKYFRDTVFHFLQPDLSRKSSNPKTEFIPYFQERDRLGNLLSSKKHHKIASMTVSPKSTAANFRSFDGSHLPAQTMQGFNFDNFRYQPKLTNSPSANLKRILKPIETEPKSLMSPCFKTKPREQPHDNHVPSVGYYTTSDKLLHKSTSEVTFSKGKKLLPVNPKEVSVTEEEGDIVKTFNKVYQRPQLIPDFAKQTNRDSHFLSKLQFPEEKRKRNMETSSYYSDVKVKYNSNAGKDNTNDMNFRLKQAYGVSSKNLPLTNTGLNDKFVQVKKKYNIFYVKLK